MKIKYSRYEIINGTLLWFHYDNINVHFSIIRLGINKKIEFLLLKTNDKLFKDEEDDLLSESTVTGKISFNRLNSINYNLFYLETASTTAGG